MRNLKLYLYCLLKFIPFFKRKLNFIMSLTELERIVINRLLITGYQGVTSNTGLYDPVSKKFELSFNVDLKNVIFTLIVDIKHKNNISKIEYTIPQITCNEDVFNEGILIKTVINSLIDDLKNKFQSDPLY